jgi:hypothetical protein
VATDVVKIRAVVGAAGRSAFDRAP